MQEAGTQEQPAGTQLALSNTLVHLLLWGPACLKEGSNFNVGHGAESAAASAGTWTTAAAAAAGAMTTLGKGWLHSTTLLLSAAREAFGPDPLPLRVSLPGGSDTVQCL